MFNLYQQFLSHQCYFIQGQIKIVCIHCIGCVGAHMYMSSSDVVVFKMMML